MSFSGNAAYRMLMVMAKIFPKMMHGYSCVPLFPESKRCFNEAVRMLNEV